MVSNRIRLLYYQPFGYQPDGRFGLHGVDARCQLARGQLEASRAGGGQ
jgi:hypothetical protein